jgi:hypothetical protein
MKLTGAERMARSGDDDVSGLGGRLESIKGSLGRRHFGVQIDPATGAVIETPGRAG